MSLTFSSECLRNTPLAARCLLAEVGGSHVSTSRVAPTSFTDATRCMTLHLRTICNGWWTRVLIHGSTTPSSVSGSLVTPPDRQRTAGIHAAVAPRTTLGGCPTRRSHVWCFPFTSKCFPVVRRQEGGGGLGLPLRAPCSGHLRDPQATTGAVGFPKANLHAS